MIEISKLKVNDDIYIWLNTLNMIGSITYIGNNKFLNESGNECSFSSFDNMNEYYNSPAECELHHYLKTTKLLDNDIAKMNERIKKTKNKLLKLKQSNQHLKTKFPEHFI